MKFNNQKIYQLATELANNLSDLTTYIPAKANFFLQKNIMTMITAAQEIDKARVEVLKHYGTLNEETNQYDISQDKIAEASREIEDLFMLEQELDIKTFSIESLGNAEFTPAQMQAMLFMIEE